MAAIVLCLFILDGWTIHVCGCASLCLMDQYMVGMSDASASYLCCLLCV